MQRIRVGFSAVEVVFNYASHRFKTICCVLEHGKVSEIDCHDLEVIAIELSFIVNFEINVIITSSYQIIPILNLISELILMQWPTDLHLNIFP